jgi:GWxTD domain-containing protein
VQHQIQHLRLQHDEPVGPKFAVRGIDTTRIVGIRYVRALIRLDAHRVAVLKAALGANGGALTMRIKRLLRQNKTLMPRLAAFTLPTIVLVSATFCVGSTVRAQSDEGNKSAATSQREEALSGTYRRWVDQDVHWIITPEERTAYLSLKTGAQRDHFIQQFWERRNPPGAPPYTFRQEHYRRLAYANEHFASNVPGWETHRGHIYIVYGPPDWIDSQPARGNGSSAPFEIWHYRHIQEYEPLGPLQGTTGYKAAGLTRNNVDFTFVDICNCGDYQ